MENDRLKSIENIKQMRKKGRWMMLPVFVISALSIVFLLYSCYTQPTGENFLCLGFVVLCLGVNIFSYHTSLRKSLDDELDA